MELQDWRGVASRLKCRLLGALASVAFMAVGWLVFSLDPYHDKNPIVEQGSQGSPGSQEPDGKKRPAAEPLESTYSMLTRLRLCDRLTGSPSKPVRYEHKWDYTYMAGAQLGMEISPMGHAKYQSTHAIVCRRCRFSIAIL